MREPDALDSARVLALALLAVAGAWLLFRVGLPVVAVVFQQAGFLAAPLLYASTGLGPALLLKGFAAAAVGGIGNNRGALIAGYIIGIAEALAAAALSPGYQLASTFAVTLVILLIRPHGLFGRAEARSV